MKRMITTTALALGALAFAAPVANAGEPVLSGHESVNVPGGAGHIDLHWTVMNGSTFDNTISGDVAGFPVDNNINVP
ncbi:hypothetical protein FKR81_16040 [Lentzea tibetensis]|uniref:Uncharacterized protein n=1 Tax=Lentzea tibetensis TaxID=2591470 RepID=A0A563ETY7_9PSEU|nr:hypothetical protein [Lentzea tibetensis]TWP51136.1 hypothetical protein FKR81_16040 [Lentzea tibetensis]